MDPRGALAMIPHMPYTLNTQESYSLFCSFRQSVVKLNVKVNSLCLSLIQYMKMMNSTIFVHLTFMVTDFGFSSEMQWVNKLFFFKTKSNYNPSFGLVALLNMDDSVTLYNLQREKRRRRTEGA